MAKLAKIRLTGCHYDGMTKQHENSIFDLTQGEEADHALFTLINGGGKGVMMQLIFQLLLPDTKWGENDGNKVISMFYDKRNNLHPFTFHVVLEWTLDTVPAKRLITGIAVKPILKNTADEEEERTGLAYFLYTHEHDNKGYFSIENLPLYNSKNGEVMDAGDLEKFLDEHRPHFNKYSQTSVKRKDAPYYTELERRGIYRSDWASLKSINKSEGGVTKYFAGASDNKALFDKVIIPVISGHIKNYGYEEEDSLIEMFKSNLSITKDLPVLIKREADFKDLLIEIKPLIENADSGSRFEDMRERTIDEGNDIFFVIKEEYTRVIEEVEKWDLEVKKAAEESRNLIFEKDNLIYNLNKRDLDDQINENRYLEEELKRLAEELEILKAKLEEYRINEVLFERYQTDADIRRKIAERESLIASLDIEDIKLRAASLERAIEEEWEKVKNAWQITSKNYYGYINYWTQVIEKNYLLIKQNKNREKVLQNGINKFEIKEANLAKEATKLEGLGYDALSLLYPERLEGELINSKDALAEEIKQLEAEIISYQEQDKNLTVDIKQLEYRQEEKSQRVTLLQEQAQKQEKDELNLARRLAKKLLENYAGTLLTPAWLREKLDSLTRLEEQNRAKLEEVQKTIWEKSLDKLLNQEAYFIPNADLLLVKQEIARLDIYVETGTEYLQGLAYEEQLELLQTYPGFLFGLVITNEKDAELIEKNIKADLFLHNMVPIYIRAAMGGEVSLPFKSLSGRAIDLINADNFLAWRGKMLQELGELIQFEKDIKYEGQEIRLLKDEVKFILQTEMLVTLNHKIKEKQGEITELDKSIRDKEAERLGIKNSLTKMEADLKNSISIYQQLIKDLEKLQIYIDNLNSVEAERLIIDQVKIEQAHLLADISRLDEESLKAHSKISLVEKNYYAWETEVKHIVRQIKDFLAGAAYESRGEKDYINEQVPQLVLGAEELRALIQARQIVETDINSKNSSIAVLDEQIKNLKNKQEDLLKQLRKISSNWQEYTYLGLALNELQIKIDEVSNNIDILEKEQEESRSLYDRSIGSINSKQKQLVSQAARILKEHQKPVKIKDEPNINILLDIVERDIISNQVYASHCQNDLQRYKDEERKLDISLSKIKHNNYLDNSKGKSEATLKARIQQNPDLLVEEWLRKFARNIENIARTADEGERFRLNFIKRVNMALTEEQLKDKILNEIRDIRKENFRNNLATFKSMENHFRLELNNLSQDKSRAEDVMKQWTQRAAIHVLRMVEALKAMIASMNYINEKGYAFPLVKLKAEERLPREESDISYLLNEYFMQTIAKVIERQDINNLNDHELKELMGDNRLFSKALQGRYPILMVYKMSENNEFRYARARDEYYTTWEAINKGEGYSPEGSGGQTLSVNTFVIMMLISFKNKHQGNDSPSTVLIMDNPFGQASSRHVLDPIFEIADKLNFQLICFASPDIIKVGISERFPIFWELKLDKGKVVHGGRVIKDI